MHDKDLRKQYDYRLYLCISRPAYKSNWKNISEKWPNFEKNIMLLDWILRHKTWNKFKNVNYFIIFYDPRISRIEKIFRKNGLKFLNLYASIYSTLKIHAWTGKKVTYFFNWFLFTDWQVLLKAACRISMFSMEKSLKNKVCRIGRILILRTEVQSRPV
jgi:hypothetical protein